MHISVSGLVRYRAISWPAASERVNHFCNWTFYKDGFILLSPSGLTMVSGAHTSGLTRVRVMFLELS